MSLINKCGWLLFLFISQWVFALPEDRKEKILIKADNGIYNYKTGKAIYEGHVKVDQGATHLEADRVTTANNDQHKIKEAIAYGLQQLAHYWTLPNTGEKELHANAEIISYYPFHTHVILKKKVNVVQGTNHFEGQLVHYNMDDEVISVPPSKEARAVLIYDPDQ